MGRLRLADLCSGRNGIPSLELSLALGFMAVPLATPFSNMPGSATSLR